MDDFDVVFMSMPSLVKMYRERGINTELHYHGFNGAIPSMLEKRDFDPSEKLYDFTFWVRLGSVMVWT